MRTGCVTAVGVMALSLALPAMAAGRSASDVCVGAGLRVGSAAFAACVAGAAEDDPLAALDGGGDLNAQSAGMAGRKTVGVDPLSTLEPAKPALSPKVGVPATVEEMPASFNTPGHFGPPPVSPGGFPGGPTTPPPGNQGGSWPGPTPPTAPTLPMVTQPIFPWNTGSQ